jgi:hypothetical protein
VDQELVDLEDRERGAFIHSRDMLHLIVELFGVDLITMVHLQRLTAAIIADRIRPFLKDRNSTVTRSGDDVFVEGGKLTVSIATSSPVSSLMHFGINVDTTETPVKAAGLGPLKIPVEEFGAGLLTDLASEIEGIIAATCKVRAVFGKTEA